MKLGNFLKAYFLSFALIFVAAAQENKSTQEAASQAEKIRPSNKLLKRA